MDGVQQISPTIAKPVVHVISDAGPHPYFRTLIETGGMDPRSVIVGCVGPAGALQEEMSAMGVETFALDVASRSQYPAAVARLARLLRKAGAPVLQTHLVDGSLVGLAAGRVARVPVAVFTAHHSHELPYHGRKLQWPDRLCAGPLCDHIIAPSQQVANTLVRYTHVDPAKIAVVHHGFDLNRLDPSSVSGTAIRSELGFGDSVVIGAIGRIYALKNYANLVRAFAGLESMANLKLVIAGGGDGEPLRALAEQLGIAEQVVLIGYRPDIPELLAACDAFVHPAIAESFGMVIIEAMAMGKPVLTTPVGIAPEVITHAETGFFAAVPSVEALQAALRELLAARPVWDTIGQAARDRVSGFGAATMAGRYASLYADWLSGSRRRGANGSRGHADS